MFFFFFSLFFFFLFFPFSSHSDFPSFLQISQVSKYAVDPGIFNFFVYPGFLILFFSSWIFFKSETRGTYFFRIRYPDFLRVFGVPQEIGTPCDSGIFIIVVVPNFFHVLHDSGFFLIPLGAGFFFKLLLYRIFCSSAFH